MNECCENYLVDNMNDDLEPLEEEILICNICNRYHRHINNGWCRYTEIMTKEEIEEYLNKVQE